MATKRAPTPRLEEDQQGQMQELFGLLTQSLIAQLKQENTPAAVLNVARQMLKDNGIEADVRTNVPLQDLRDTVVPFPSNSLVEPDDEESEEAVG